MGLAQNLCVPFVRRYGKFECKPLMLLEFEALLVSREDSDH